MLLLVSCTSYHTEEKYTVTDHEIKGDYIILTVPETDIGALVFRIEDVIIVESDSNYVRVTYYEKDNMVEIDSIFLYLKTKINL